MPTSISKPSKRPSNYTRARRRRWRRRTADSRSACARWTVNCRKKNRELALTTEYLNSILDSMSDGVIAVDVNGAITTFNRAAETILGYPAAEMIGEDFESNFGRAFLPAAGEAVSKLRTIAGTAVRVHEQDAPLADRTEQRLGTVKVFQDLREIEALREQVRRKDRLAALGEMAATVAHEIRNPLGGIRGFATLLEQDTPADDPRHRLIQKIVAGTKNLDRVVNELLEYTRPVDPGSAGVCLRGTGNRNACAYRYR